MELDKILNAHLIKVKWQRYRDSTYRILTTFQPDDTKFRNRMKLLQTVIKNYAELHKLDLIVAVTKLGEKEEDAIVTVQILAAGYELCDGRDYTVDEPKLETV